MRLITILALLVGTPIPAVAQGPSLAAERLLIDKSDRTLTILFTDGSRRTLDGLRFGRNWAGGPKREQGDDKTPEGDYQVLEYRASRAVHPNVIFMPALYLDYPNAADLAASAALGVHPGGAIMIHGPHPDFSPAELSSDWTDGCAALSAAQIHYLMRYTRQGTPVRIQP